MRVRSRAPHGTAARIPAKPSEPYTFLNARVLGLSGFRYNVECLRRRSGRRQAGRHLGLAGSSSKARRLPLKCSFLPTYKMLLLFVVMVMILCISCPAQSCHCATVVVSIVSLNNIVITMYRWLYPFTATYTIIQFFDYNDWQVVASAMANLVRKASNRFCKSEFSARPNLVYMWPLLRILQVSCPNPKSLRP